MAKNNVGVPSLAKREYRELVFVLFHKDSFILQEPVQSSVWLKKMNEVLARGSEILPVKITKLPSNFLAVDTFLKN